MRAPSRRKAVSTSASARLRRDQILGSELQRLSSVGCDENSGDVRLPDYVAARIGAKVTDCLLCHVVDISHVILETGDTPPEAERVCEPRCALPIECGSHGAMRLHRLQLIGAEVPGRIELCDFSVQCGQGGA